MKRTKNEMKPMNKINTITNIIAGTLLSTNALAQECTTTVSAFAMSEQTAIAADVLVSEDGRFEASNTCGDTTWKVFTENDFGQDPNITNISYTTTKNGMTIKASLGYDSGTQADIALGKTMGENTYQLSLLGTTNNISIHGQKLGKNIDAGIQLTNDNTKAYFIGAHNNNPDAFYGAWIGKGSADEQVGVAITKNDSVSTFTLGKHRTDNSGWLINRTAFGQDVSGTYTKETGQLVAQVLPGVGPKGPDGVIPGFGSYLTEGKTIMQLVHNESADGTNTYTEMQLGLNFGNIGIGAGYKFGDQKGIVTEAMVKLPFGLEGTLRLDQEADQKYMVGVSFNKKW